MTEYKLTEAFFKELQRRIWTRLIPLMLVTLAVVVWIANRTSRMSLSAWFSIAIVGGLWVLMLVRGVSQQRESWSTYRLTMDDEAVTRKRRGWPDARIPFGEISHLVEIQGQGLRIEALSPQRRIAVPLLLENYDNLRAALQARHSIELIAGPRAKLLSVRSALIFVLILASIVLFFVSSNLYLAAVLGIGFVALLIFGIIGLLRQHGPARFKWLTVILSIVAIVAFGGRTALAIGGLLGYPGPLSMLGHATWTQIRPPTRPPATALAGFAYDEARQQEVVFGGLAAGAWSDQTWIWDGSNWSQPQLSIRPKAREKAAMAYDEATGKIVLFGGRRDQLLYGDTWEWDGHSWTEIQPAHSPPARCCHAMAYDPAQKKVLLYGGWDFHSNAFFSDTWAWDGHDWTHLRTASIYPAGGHGLVDFPSSGMVITVPSSQNAMTWRWNGADWKMIPSEPSPARADAGSAYDPSTRTVLLFGGASANGLLNDLWSFDGQVWNPLALSSPPPVRYGHVMFYDLKRRSIMIFGGASQAGLLDDMWEIRLPSNLSGLISRGTLTPVPSKNPNPSSMQDGMAFVVR